jgi:hypothetical protein
MKHGAALEEEEEATAVPQIITVGVLSNSRTAPTLISFRVCALCVLRGRAGWIIEGRRRVVGERAGVRSRYLRLLVKVRS